MWSDTPCWYELSALYTVHAVLEKVCAGPQGASLVAPPGTASLRTARYPHTFGLPFGMLLSARIRICLGTRTPT